MTHDTMVLLDEKEIHTVLGALLRDGENFLQMRDAFHAEGKHSAGNAMQEHLERLDPIIARLRDASRTQISNRILSGRSS